MELFLVYASHKTRSWAFSRRSRAVAAKKCTKKRDARAKLPFWLINLLLIDVLVAAVVFVVAKTPSHI